jgi:tetratricopeptide (TPR) repeat protein
MEVFFGARLDSGEWDARMREAADYFHRAAALDTTFVVPLLWALYAHWNAGDLTKRDSLAHAMSERRDRLTRWERALLDAHLAHVRRDLPAVYRAYARVVEMTPGSEWNFKLAQAAYTLNRPQEAVDLLSQVDPERGWLVHWELYWQLLARSRHWLGQHEQELRDAQRGLIQLPESDRLRALELLALIALGEVELPVSPPDAFPWWAIVEELRWHGHESAANEVIMDYLARHDPSQEAYYSQARAAYWLEKAGRTEAAEAILESAVEEDPDDLWAWGRLGAIAAKHGDRERALRISSQLGERVRPPKVPGRATYYRAIIAANLGDRDRAVELLGQALREGWFASALHASDLLEPLRDYPPFQELVRPKG